VKLDALADSYAFDVFVSATLQSVCHSLALRVQKVSLRHDLNDDLWHVSPKFGFLRAF
jgi:hypothetical protein